MDLSIAQLFSKYEPQKDPYATHVNLLRALGLGVRTVLELGAGRYSTPLFLDRTAYPDLQSLTTIESDPAWAGQCRTADPRHCFVLHPEPIEPWLLALKIENFDLILCDNSSSGERRCATLRWLSQNAMGKVVVAHDYEIQSYHEAAAGFTNAIVDDRQRPWTALLWRVN